MRSVRIKTKDEYEVLIDAGLIDRAGEYIYSVAGGEIAVVVTDDNVAVLYLERLRASLHKSGYKTVVFTIRNGEASKNIFTLSRVLEFLAEKRVTRTDIIVALGGGVVGDLAGFAAAVYMRGISYVQVPTTLLAAVDSSVGGKTAVDLDAGKNLAGAFHQPRIVICDRSILEKLPPRIFVDGCAEVIKYAMVTDAELFDMLLNQSPIDLEEVIFRCVRIKRDLVSEDEFENGARKLLSFGHTVGHAVELLSKFNMAHGQAVSIGMALETMAAVKIGMCGEDCYTDLIGLLHKYGLPYKSPYSGDRIARAVLADKKRRSGNIVMALPRRIGKCILCDVEVEKLERIIFTKS